MNINVYNQSGEKVRSIRLSSEVFGIKSKSELIHQVVVAMRANQRQPWAHVKTRAEVRGGGRKPWRQKGTGRARHGSIRSPLWRGGGVTFGPGKERTYQQKINKKVKRKALLMCLSDKMDNQKLIVLDKLEVPEIKTKKLVEILDKLPFRQRRTIAGRNKILLAIEKKDQNILKSAANIPYLKLINPKSLNILDLLKYDYFLTTVPVIKIIERIYSVSKTK